MDTACTEREQESVYVTITVDEIVNNNVMRASECQPYNSIQVALSIYETCGGQATVVVMDADLVVTQLTSTKEVVEAASKMQQGNLPGTRTNVLCCVYAEKYNTCESTGLEGGLPV